MRTASTQRGSREFEELAPYLKAVRDYPPLSRDDEHALAIRARKGEVKAKQKLVRHNLAFVVAIARKQRRGTVRLDDLIQEGNVGLMRAVEKFDPHAGTRFSTYAVWWIRAYVGKYLKEARSTVRPQSGTVAQPDLSLDSAIDEEGDATHLDRIEDDGPGPEDNYLQSEGRSRGPGRAREGPQADWRARLGHRPQPARAGSAADARGDWEALGRLARARSPGRAEDEAVPEPVPDAGRARRGLTAANALHAARSSPGGPPLSGAPGRGPFLRPERLVGSRSAAAATGPLRHRARQQGRILKAPPAPAGRRIEAAVWDADRCVREMVAAAEATARRIVAEAEGARDRVRGRGGRGGAAGGRGAGGLRPRSARRRRAIGCSATAEHELAGLAIAVARKVLGRELAAGGAVAALAANALAEVRARREVAVHVHPADAAELRAAHGTLAALLVHAPLELREDPALERGASRRRDRGRPRRRRD